MADDYKVIIAPLLVNQLEELGIKEQARDAIRDAMSNPEQAGKQLTRSLFPYRRLRVGRYRIIYKVVTDTNPTEVRFLYCALRKQGAKKDVYKKLERLLERGEVG